METERKLGKFMVGQSHPPIFFAEVGSYYNGDYALAESMIASVIKAIKLVPHQPAILKTEILNNPEICLKSEVEETYTNKTGAIKKENYRTLIERKVMSLDNYKKLFKFIKDSGIDFVVSVYDFEAADFAKEQGAAALKIASSNIVHIPLIRHVATLGLPVVVDTGRSSLAEVYNAVSNLRKFSCSNIIVQHSPDGHPALPKAHNLKMLQTYQQCFNLPTGLSDHYIGTEMLYMSIALGACVLEKGLNFDPNDLDQDISHSMSFEALPGVLQSVYDCWQALGKTERNFNDKIEGVIGASQRQCLVAKSDLKPGDKISLEKVRFAFPCLGIPVEHWDIVNGREILSAIEQNTPIEWEDVAK